MKKIRRVTEGLMKYKRCVILAAIFMIASGCSGKKTLVSLEEAVNMKMDGDKSLLVYYEDDGQTVEDVKLGEASLIFEGVIKEIHGASAVIEADEGFPIRNSGDMVSVTLDQDAALAQVGDRVRVTYSGAVMETYPLQLEKQSSIEPLGREESDRIPMVMIEGSLYQSVGEISDMEGRCGVMDGEITSSVEGTEIPLEDGQSNFGTGYGYQRVDGEHIDIYMPFGDPDKWEWVRFEKSEENDREESCIMREPPALRIHDALSSANNKFEVSSGNYSWYCRTENEEEMTGGIACGAGPLDEAKEKGRLKLPRYNRLEDVPYTVSWEEMPDSMTIKEYNITDLGKMDAEALSITTYDEIFIVNLKPNRVYEIVAEWMKENLDKKGFYGDASYVVVTE